MPDLELQAEPRTVLGKKVAALRRGGLTPANIYGHSLPSRAVQVPTLELSQLLRRAGHTQLVRLQVAGEAAPRMVLVRTMYEPTIKVCAASVVAAVNVSELETFQPRAPMLVLVQA